MRTMWTIASGRSSDYAVHCVCATKEIAEALAAGRADWTIGEIPLMESGDVLAPTVYDTVIIAVSTGELIGAYTHSYGPWEAALPDIDGPGGPVGQEWTAARSSRGQDVAIKIAQDTRAQLLLAERAGIA